MDQILRSIKQHAGKTRKLHRNQKSSIAVYQKEGERNRQRTLDQRNIGTTTPTPSSPIKKTIKRTTLEGLADASLNLHTALSSTTKPNRWKSSLKKITQNRFEQKNIRKIIRSTTLFTEIMTDPMIEQLVQGSVSMDVKHGTWLFREGNPGDGMYIVQEGSVEIWKKKPGVKDEDNENDSDEHHLHVDTNNYTFHVALARGAVFGEKSMILNAPRTTAARCMFDEGSNSKSSVIFIPKALYLRLTTGGRGSSKRMGEQLLKAKERIVQNGIMDRVECFKDLSKDQKLKLIDVMRRVVHQKGTYICKQNDIGTTLHIIIQGEVQVTINNRSEANGEKKIVTLGQVVFVDVLVSKLCCF